MTKTTTETALSDLDRLALERAVAIERARNPACRQRIDQKMIDQGWLAGARDAAHHCQEISLHLPPWQCWPPCVVKVGDVDPPGCEHRGITASAKLLRKMLACGVSRWEPDVLRALEARASQ